MRRPARIRFRGALDAATIEIARARIADLLEENPRDVIVDMSEVELLDSTGVHVLVALHKRLAQKGGKLAVVGAKDQPLAVLDVLKLTAWTGR